MWHSPSRWSQSGLIRFAEFSRCRRSCQRRDTRAACPANGTSAITYMHRKVFRFWVTKPGGHTTGFYDQEVIENGAIKTVSKYTTEYWTDRGIEFIEKNKGQPFFLLLAYNGPYGLSPLLLREARNRHASFYADKPYHHFLANNASMAVQQP
jgi:hypothetical protein